jgi:hypothetical protein
MMTNLVLFIACAPLWLLVVIGAGVFAAVVLPLTPAALPARDTSLGSTRQRAVSMPWGASRLIGWR